MSPRIYNHKLVTGLFSTALAFVVGGFVWALVTLGVRSGGGAGRFILHFNDVSGITQLGRIGDLWFAGIFAAIAVVVNYVIALELDARDRVLGKAMAVVTLAAAILLFIACAAILSVN